jgi:phenylalanyl-tRNA synthetase beta chain
MIRNVKIGPSPDWMVRRLEAVGMRSINNVVDVTNYVMMELGHPMHAFDFKLLEEGRIVVKRAQEGETFTTLDDQEHTMVAEDLMICDGKRPVAMAGVMGGLNSEVQEDSETILLEAAYFKPTAIRRTSKRHGLHTESSHRFERGADIDMIPVALDRAASLIAELGDGNVLAGVIDNYPQTLKTPVLELDVAKVEALLDIPLDSETVQVLLESIGLTVKDGSAPSSLQVTVPSFRPDLEREVDLIEEVARLYGYDRIPVTMPVGTVNAALPPLRQQVQTKLRNCIVADGFSEAMNYSFYGTDDIGKLGIAADDPRTSQVNILNPLSEDQSVMRTSLVPSLLETVARNLAYRSSDLRLFELRPVFLPQQNDTSCQERLTLTAVACGRRQPEGWAQTEDPVDFYDLKAVAENLFAAVYVSAVEFSSEQPEPYLHPGKSCCMVQSGKKLGSIGEVHPQVLSAFDIDLPVYLLEIDVETLLSVAGEYAKFKPLSRFPDVIRDSALLLDESISAADIMTIIDRTKIKYLEDAVLFDLYTGKGIPDGKKSLAVRIRYRELDKTLTEEEVVKAHNKLIKSICHQLGAEIR